MFREAGWRFLVVLSVKDFVIFIDIISKNRIKKAFYQRKKN